jgi:hypothetical protein
MHSRDTHKRPSPRAGAHDVDGEARSDDERPLDVVVDAELPGSRRIVVSLPARFVRAEERTVQAVVADAADAALIPPPAGPGDGGGGH